ncbi:kinase [Fusarium phyllophilum]|uniref:Kinase n=1 Tax=Fusarium phyllophilum TaxID=47803 RepID=A0A8H5J9D3_9HYPO|nr:kinase [Fusarium phyllophilum]
MIDHESRYFALSGDIPVGGPTTWHIVDWDQRRVVSVTMDGEQDDESLAIEHFSRYSDQLSPAIYRIHLSHTGEIIWTSTDPKNDTTCCVHYPSLHDAYLPEGVQTVQRDKLEELKRLGPDADLVVMYYPFIKLTLELAVFKYYFLWQYAQMSWKEMNLWMRLPHHPNIVPFDRVVVNEVEGRVVRFTSNYIPSRNLEQNKSRVFKLKWLQQLIRVVDDLNLEYGIAHQDIAPRNLLIDEPKDSIMLFDFNFAARISCPSPGEGESYFEDRNDVNGVIFTAYEIITQDDSLRSMPHEDQNLGNLGSKWTKHSEVKLDHPVESYRLTLQEWRERREGGSHPGNVPRPIVWPAMPKPPQKTISLKTVQGQTTSVTVDSWYERRQDIRDRGDKVLNWERPPQRLIDNGIQVLSTGEIING